MDAASATRNGTTWQPFSRRPSRSAAKPAAAKAAPAPANDEVRHDLIAKARRRIDAGLYDTDAVLDVTIDRLTKVL